jgi:hypothetical protein
MIICIHQDHHNKPCDYHDDIFIISFNMRQRPNSNKKHNKTCHKRHEQIKNEFSTACKLMIKPLLWVIIAAIATLMCGYFAMEAISIAKIQSRAYVMPVFKGLPESDFSIEIAFVNVGQTPAKVCAIKGDIIILPYPLPNGYVFDTSIKQRNDMITSASIYPRYDSTLPASFKPNKEFTKAEVTEIKAQSAHRRAYVYGILEYKDVFDDNRSTEFCFVMVPTTNININWIACDRNTDFN